MEMESAVSTADTKARLTADARAAWNSALQHKAQMYRSRRALQRAMADFRRLERTCQEFGITLIFQDKD